MTSRNLGGKKKSRKSIGSISAASISIKPKDRAPIKNHNNHNNHPHHSTKEAITKCKKGNKKHQAKEWSTKRTGIQRDLNRISQVSSVFIYCEERKTGWKELSCRYCETVEQEGGEIFTISNGIRFLPFTVSDSLVILETTHNIEQKGGRNSNGLF